MVQSSIDAMKKNHFLVDRRRFTCSELHRGPTPVHGFGFMMIRSWYNRRPENNKKANIEQLTNLLTRPNELDVDS